MSTETIVLIIAAFIASILISLFQYYKTIKKGDKVAFLFAFLRFLSVFAILLLLINPSFKKRTYFSEKPKLVASVDNSSSIKHLDLDNEVDQIVNRLKQDEELNSRFDLEFYSFSEDIKDTLALSYDGLQTNIARSLEQLDQVYKNKTAPIILISDGNQTYGKDYQYLGPGFKQQIYPVAVGDTSAVFDTKINRLNVNRYAFLKNKFPVEIFLSYNGKEEINTTLNISSGGNNVYSKNIDFSKDKTSEVVNFSLPASMPGIQVFNVNLQPVSGEKNTINNATSFAVEVIDQKTNVLIVSNILHPDIGAFKKSIESNERRSVTVKSPLEVSDLEEYQLIILYQPNSRFNTLFEQVVEQRKNYFIVAASSTDWVFLNRIQEKYKQEITRQTEYYLPRFNGNYTSFLIDDLGFRDFPPLIGNFGEIAVNGPSDVILYRNINEIETSDPLLLTSEEDGIRTGMLLGEGIWRWRATAYLQNENFENFDEFLGKIVQYLASNKRKSRLNTIADPFYYGNTGVLIKAEYFTKNYEFDSRGNLQIDIRNKETGATQTVPMLLKNNSYEINLSSLQAGTYDFTVRVVGENLSSSGTFTVLAYDVEQQFIGSDVTKLSQLATNTKGQLYFSDQMDGLIEDLISDDRYKIVQKSNETVVSLIDWKYLLLLIVILLTAEWFLRKYYGHI